MGAATQPAISTIYHLRVTLRDVSPLVWRRVLVRSDTTIAQLHDVLQIAMGWEDAHLQQFRMHGKADGVYHEGGDQHRLCGIHDQSGGEQAHGEEATDAVDTYGCAPLAASPYPGAQR